jgi:hypothetical protein
MYAAMPDVPLPKQLAGKCGTDQARLLSSARSKCPFQDLRFACLSNAAGKRGTDQARLFPLARSKYPSLNLHCVSALYSTD